MSSYLFLIPISLGLGLIGLGTFLWTLQDNQYDDMDGASYRILDSEDKPIVDSSETDIKKN